MRLRLFASLSAFLIVAACAGEPERPPAPPPPRTSADLTRALFTADELKAEGGGQPVQVARQAFLAACVTDRPTAHTLAVWEFPGDRHVKHAVESYGRPADLIEVLRGQTACLADGPRAFPGPVLGALDVDAQHSWCFTEKPGFRCGGAVAMGDLLVAVEASAEDQHTAEAVVARLFPSALRGVERVGVRSAAAPTTTTTTTSFELRTAADLLAAALTPDELAGEGRVTFSGARQTPYLELCLDVRPTTKSLVLWELPNKRSLTHVVESYERAAEQLSYLQGRTSCLTGGASPLAGPETGDLPVDGLYSWCHERDGVRACGAVVADGDLLMAVVVEAESMDAAAEVVERVMPTAVAALERA